MIKKHLLTLAVTAFYLVGCVKPEPVTLAGENFYLISAIGGKSKYEQISYQFKHDQVEVFAITNLKPMIGDVTIGPYTINNNTISLPLIGSFESQATTDGFDLYKNNKLKYHLSKRLQPFTRPNQRQYQFALAVK